MNTEEMASDYIFRAGRCFKEASTAYEEEDYPGCVRRSQECIELSIKGVLRRVGIEFPKVHDVSDVLLEIEVGFPDWFKERIHRIAKTMADITPKRGPAFYGFEKELKTAKEVFKREDASGCLDNASFVFNSCKQLLKEWYSKHEE